jgi:hypothetical protein
VHILFKGMNFLEKRNYLRIGKCHHFQAMLRILSSQKYLTDFMYSYDCQILGSKYTHSTNDLVCRRSGDDLILGKNM